MSSMGKLTRRRCKYGKKIADLIKSPWFECIEFVALMVAIVALIYTARSVTLEIEHRQHERTFMAWNILTLRAAGNSGKIQALEYLNDNGFSLQNIDLSPPGYDKSKKIDTAMEFVSACPQSVYLRGVRLEYSKLNFSSMPCAILLEAKLKYSELAHADFRWSILGVTPSILNSSTTHVLASKETASLVFEYGFMEQIRLEDIAPFATNLSHADLQFVDFRGSQLGAVDLSDAILYKADFRGADLAHANLEDAFLEGTDLRETKSLTCEQLWKALDWKEAYRDNELACEGDIPVRPQELK